MQTVSMIIPVYNNEECIERCLNSALQQTFFEHEDIIIDDGSIDKGSTLCDNYALIDKRILVIHKKNEGVSIARNLGTRLSTGDYITYLDSDDWVSNEYLEKMLMLAKKYIAQVIVCGYNVSYEQEKKDVCEEKEEQNIYSSREAIDYFGNASLSKSSAHFRSPWAKLIKREIAIETPFPTDRTYAEDGACIYLWLWRAKTIVETKTKLYYYFQNPKGICHQSIGPHILGNFLTESEWIEFFKKNRFTNLYQKFCLRYIEDTMWAYDNANNCSKDIFKEVMKSGLKKYRRPAKLKYKNILSYEEILHPNRAKMYWAIKEYLGKIK